MKVAARALLALVVLGCNGTDGDVLTPRATTLAARLIMHGHDLPTGAAELSELRQRLPAVEALPFDGMTVDLGVRDDVFTATALDPGPRQAAVDELRAIPFRRLTDNFQLLRLPLRELDWFDDALFAAVAANMEAAARLARAAGLRGFLFDNQTYGTRLFAYTPDARPGRSFADVQARVAARGEAVMAAALRGFPDLVVMVEFGYSEIARMVCIEGAAFDAHPYALWPAFLDGMLRALTAARTSGAIVDGYLPAYPTHNPDDFAVYYNLIHFRWDRLMDLWHPGLATHWDAMPVGQKRVPWRATPQLVCDRDTVLRLGRDLPAGFGLMVDYDVALGNTFQTAPGALDQNYFSPAAFEAALTGALRATDRYVWLWHESFSWWGLRRAAQPPPPQPYLDAIARARQRAGRSGP